MTPDSVHAKLKTLWDQLMAMHPAHVNRKKAVVMLDRRSREDLWYDMLAHDDGSLRHGMWRDMVIEVVHVMHPSVPSYDDEEVDFTEAPREPICVSLRVTKDNGRIVYIDHPDTDEVYK